MARSVEASLLYISSITLMELEQGVALMERRDPAQGAVLRAWLEDQALPTFKSSVHSFDGAAAKICGRLQVPDLRSFRDRMVAATALAHRATQVTRNMPGISGVAGLRLLNPWDDDGR